MADANSQPSTTPPAGGSTPPAAPDPGGTTQPPAAPAAPAAGDTVDLSKLTGDQLNKVLENPELWNLPRIKELREAQAQLKKTQDDAAKAADDKLASEKKFEELATKKGEEVTQLQTKIQEMNVNQSLTQLLIKENVVDLDGALKLVDRSKITVADDGTVTGADEALKSLKTDRSYLFSGTNGGGATPPTVGTPSNPTQTPTNQNGFKFKESQLTPEFYKAHKAEVDEAGRLGLIEADGSPQMQ